MVNFRQISFFKLKYINKSNIFILLFYWLLTKNSIQQIEISLQFTKPYEKQKRMKTLQRPKSAVLLSLPYNFQNKQEAVDIKQKVKKSFITFQSDSTFDNDFFNDSSKFSIRSYIDNGPSLLNVPGGHYSLKQNRNSMNRNLKNSRPQSSVSLRRTSKQYVTGLESYQKLKPSRKINEKSLQNISEFLQGARKQTKFIDRIFENISSKNYLVKKPQSGSIKKLKRTEQENSFEISGKNNSAAFEEMKVNSNFIEQTPYKSNGFQPTLQRKSMQVFKRSKAYLMARV